MSWRLSCTTWRIPGQLWLPSKGREGRREGRKGRTDRGDRKGGRKEGREEGNVSESVKELFHTTFSFPAKGIQSGCCGLMKSSVKTPFFPYLSSEIRKKIKAFRDQNISIINISFQNS
jgi:hypothetical protein